MVALPDPDEWYQEDAGFWQPDWNAIGKWIAANVPKESLNEAWLAAAGNWLGRLKKRLGDTFQLAESPNFFLLSELDARRTKLTLEFLENTRASLHKLLGKFALTDYSGKHACIIFRNPDDYYAYASYFYKDDGEYAESSGMFIKSGYYHFIVRGDEVSSLRHVLAHEFTHNCFAHLPLPRWLNEAVTKSIEETVAGASRFLLTRELAEKHHAYWNAETIQEFWSGKSWNDAEEGNRLSYNLSTILLRTIHQDLRPDPEQFRNFLGEAHYKDAGESAAGKHLGIGLAELAEVFLGPGDWTPKPRG